MMKHGCVVIRNIYYITIFASRHQSFLLKAHSPFLLFGQPAQPLNAQHFCTMEVPLRHTIGQLEIADGHTVRYRREGYCEAPGVIGGFPLKTARRLGEASVASACYRTFRVCSGFIINHLRCFVNSKSVFACVCFEKIFQLEMKFASR